MKVRWEQMFPGQVLHAVLTTVPGQVSRTEDDVILEIAGPAPIALHPASALGVELLEATPQEIEALERAGFKLPRATSKRWWQFWKQDQ